MKKLVNKLLDKLGYIPKSEIPHKICIDHFTVEYTKLEFREYKSKEELSKPYALDQVKKKLLNDICRAVLTCVEIEVIRQPYFPFDKIVEATLYIGKRKVR
jgi:hypothetical protein